MRRLKIGFSVCDMRDLAANHSGDFDIVLSGDNCLPHLLSNDEILKALRSMYQQLRPGGGCIITVRDYDQEARGRGIIKPFGLRDIDNMRYLVWQVWDFEGDHYNFDMYFLAHDRDSGEIVTHIMQSRYYAVPTDTLLALMAEAGFINIQRLDDAFFQPVLIGTKPK